MFIRVLRYVYELQATLSSNQPLKNAKKAPSPGRETPNRILNVHDCSPC